VPGRFESVTTVPVPNPWDTALDDELERRMGPNPSPVSPDVGDVGVVGLDDMLLVPLA